MTAIFGAEDHFLDWSVIASSPARPRQNGIWDGDEKAHNGWNLYLIQMDDDGQAVNVISETPAQRDGYYAFTPQMMSQNKFQPGKYA